MNKITILITMFWLTCTCLQSQTLFEVKDASDHSVFEISNDGIRIFNYPDTLMIISSAEIRANLDNSTKGLSRSFSVSTNTTSKEGLANVLEVTTDNTIMREGAQGDQYTNFSPDNIFIGLNSGMNTPTTYPNNVFLGNNTGISNTEGINNVFIGAEAGYSNIGGPGPLEGKYNVFLGYQSGFNNQTGGCNIFIGDEAGLHNQIGSHNIYIGTEVGKNVANISSNTNTCIGSDAFIGGNGSNNVYMGWLTGAYATGSNNVFLGSQAGDYETTSNRLFIDNSGTSTPLIYGEFDNDIVKINGNLGVGITGLPIYKVQAEDITPTNDNAAVYAKHAITEGWGIGLYAEGNWKAVKGNVTTNYNSTIYAADFSATNTGSGNAYGIYSSATTSSGTAYAGYFSGNVNVTGTISKGGGSFKIDHPLDPENKYLYHSFVESPDMKNIYDGVIVLDTDGEALVTLPEWFDALNDNFRYQLTPIGAPGPSLYISKEVINNEFQIAGGTPGMKVSWMVTGIRKDKFAEANRIPIEEDKADEDKGYYLHPSAFGKSTKRSIDEKNREKNRK
ncbi:MAG: hypothetical protein PF638_14290 [Candidatus Delongbacteria bacterium]|jgi:hypothetical protein|nr:hypothetical protein [Candidatus Delongbacteria bacterium]